ncbi:MAG: TIM barrel protein [Proteobacteria bacterium]|nr:TIM barrel protein [Pseudomonadota bacterium]
MTVDPKMKSAFNLRIGNQTSFSAASLMAPFEFAVAESFTAFEWFPDKKNDSRGWEITDLDSPARSRIKNIAKKHQISLALHAPWQASPRVPEDLVIFAEHIRFALEIGASLLTIHGDINQDVAGFARALLPLITLSREAGIKLAVENTVLTPPEEFNDLFQRLRKLAPHGLSQVGLCFDMGHANLCTATSNDYIGYLDRLDVTIPIIHLHCHENFGDRDSHLTLFTGPAADNEAGIVALLARLAARRFDGALIMEQWPEPPTLLTTARDRIEKIINRLPVPEIGKRKSSDPVPDKTSPHESPDLAPSMAAALATMDRQSKSWREKLLGVKALLKDYSHEQTEEQLAYLSIYLRFLNTGEISCTEDGRHFRPSHHARTSLEIQEMLLEKITPQTIFLIRKILPWLPSVDADFLRREPLTRIRDIAHRNDIPPELKKEIKHSLQNKLHRCAGPEDLQTASNILARITAADAHYQANFVNEFQIFYGELQDFFNANSLDSRLATLGRDPQKQTTRQAMEQFLAAKRNKNRDIRQLLEILEKNTILRSVLIPAAYGSMEPAAQHQRMTEIQLEDYAFAVFSELINALPKTTSRLFWPEALQAMTLAVSQLRLSAIDPEECAAIESMLKAWTKKFDPKERESLLLIGSLLNRCQRLAENYCERILDLFAEKAKTIGDLLALPDHAVRMYAEGDIRGSMVFQLAKLTTLLLAEIRKLANLPPWDIIVSGRASGRLTSIARLEDFRPFKGKKHILLLAEATGSEEIPRDVTAIILERPIPHLSHLAIRTRQENIVLIALLEPAAKRPLNELQGKDVAIVATADKVTISPATSSPDQQISSKEIKQNLMPEVSLASTELITDLTAAQPATCGNKAFAAGRLEELADAQKSFKTPAGLALPFGVAAEAIRQDPDRFKVYEKIVKKLAGGANRNLAEIIAQLREFFFSLTIDPTISQQIAKKFGTKTRLIVRSSANCEDLETMSGAGLYDSIANVSARSIDDAIRRVWASLWTKRAIISREKTGIPHSAAHMAILIQEMINPDYAFVLHTTNPMNNSQQELYLELTAGLGETLASAGEPGSPLRMICDKKSGESQLLTFADFSRAARPQPNEGIYWTTLNYSKDQLTCDQTFRQKITARLCAIGTNLEKTFNRPQDIEGVIKDNDIYLVQTRTQMTQANRG